MVGFPFINLAVGELRRLADRRTPEQRWPKMMAVLGGSFDLLLLAYGERDMDKAEAKITVDMDKLAQAEHEASVRQHQDAERWDGLS